MWRSHPSTLLLLSFLFCAGMPAEARNAIGDLHRPVAFEPNHGQADARADFIGRARGYTVLLSSGALVFSLPRRAVSIKLSGAKRAAAEGLDRLPGLSNYFFGSDPTAWRTNIPNYGKLRYRGVYRGIDIIFYGADRDLEFDFNLEPGAEPRNIELAIEGADRVSVERGGVAIEAAGERLLLRQPVIYQPEAQASSCGGLKPAQGCATGRYVRRAGNRIGLAIGPYDRSKPLVIDPVLSYSSYLGGTGGESITGTAVDTAGNIYLTGTTSSTNFPLANPYQSTPGTAFVTKLNAAGTAIVYSTYLGAPLPLTLNSGGVTSNAIAVDAAGNAYIVGQTEQNTLPIVNALQSVFGGGMLNAFVAKLDATGSRLLFSTYLGGRGSLAWSVDVAPDGNPIVVGNANADFPTTPGAFEQTGMGGGFVAKLKSTGEALIYSTYLGGMTGAGARAVAVDAAGNAYVAGGTTRPGFPVTPGAFQTTMPPIPPLVIGGVCFVAKLNPSGSALVYSTLLGGGAAYNGCTAIALDSGGNAVVTGFTSASDFPVTPGAFQTVFRGRNYCQEEAVASASRRRRTPSSRN